MKINHLFSYDSKTAKTELYYSLNELQLETEKKALIGFLFMSSRKEFSILTTEEKKGFGHCIIKKIGTLYYFIVLDKHPVLEQSRLLFKQIEEDNIEKLKQGNLENVINASPIISRHTLPLPELSTAELDVIMPSTPSSAQRNVKAFSTTSAQLTRHLAPTLFEKLTTPTPKKSSSKANPAATPASMEDAHERTSLLAPTPLRSGDSNVGLTTGGVLAGGTPSATILFAEDDEEEVTSPHPG